MNTTAHRDASLFDMLDRAVSGSPHGPAIIHRDGVLSYGDLIRNVDILASRLADQGITAGDRVLCIAANSPWVVAALFAAIKLGAVFVPLHPGTPEPTLRLVLADCDPAAVVLDSERWQANRLSLINHGSPVLCIATNATTGDVDCDGPWSPSPHQQLRSPICASSDDSTISLAIIIYTSGSTGRPRGVMLPHRQVLFAVRAINAVLCNSKDDRILCGLPLSFDYGLYQVFLAFAAGASLILEPDFSMPLVIPRLLSEHSVTGFPAVPSLFAMLLRAKLLERVRLPQLRYITSTGDVFPTAHIRHIKELFPDTAVLPMYGLTECKRVSIMPFPPETSREGSVGLPLAGTEVEVIDRNGQKQPPGVIGELVVRGPHVMAGYWNAPDETARRFRVDCNTGETVLHTGDLFRLDDDGFLYFVGREETTIKTLGHRLSAAEIENAACEVEGVLQAAAIGIPNDVLGEAICLIVAVRTGTSISCGTIAASLAQSLPRVARPSQIRIWEGDLPRTENGKLDRKFLKRDIVRNATAVIAERES